MMAMMIHKRATLAAITGLVLPVLMSTPARARLSDDFTVRQGVSGTAELGYVSYDASERGQKILEASSFVQRYSLLYRTAGKARFESYGNYSLALGYEWNSIDTSAKRPAGETEQSVRSGRILYDASLTLNPPKSPYELHVYSRDMTRNSISTDTLPELSNNGSIIGMGIPTDLTRSGTNIESGLRLVIGKKSGVRGAVGNFLADIPSISVDYWDMLSRNTDGGSRLDVRTSKLKVSAGGMGDTWLHYQSTDFTDKFVPDNGFTTNKIIIGTINQYQRRQWIQFTNWIKLSADARFEQTKFGNSSRNEEEFDLNIFGTASRRLWQARLFSNYNRKTVGRGAPAEELRLPLYVSGVWGANTDWSFNVSSNEKREGGVLTPVSRSSEDTLSLRVNTFKRDPFTLSSTLKLNHISNSGGGGELGADVGLETVSTSRFSRNFNLAGSYNLRTRYNKQSESYSYNQDLLLNANYQPSSEWKFSFRETVTQGKNDNGSTDFGSSTIAQGQNPLGTVTDLAVPASNFLRLATTLSAAWTPTARISTSLSGTNYVQFESTGSDSMSNAIAAAISYKLPTFYANLNGSAAMQDTGDRDISTSANVTYRPNRILEASLRGRLTQRESAGVSYKFVDAAQRLTYYVWGSRGVSRKVADLFEELAYVQENGETPKKALTLAGTYYIYARISMSGRATYLLQDGTLTQIYGAGLAANMKLLDATVDYTYAKRAADKRVENRLAATLRKSF